MGLSGCAAGPSGLCSAGYVESPPTSRESRWSPHGAQLPVVVFQPALREGFVPARELLPVPEGTVLVCRRVMTVRGARMMAAAGFYHEWLYTPGREYGMGFVGAEKSEFSGLPSRLRNVFLPMRVQNHNGAVFGGDVFARAVNGLDQAILQDHMTENSDSGYFPITNCHRWISHVTRESRSEPHRRE